MPNGPRASPSCGPDSCRRPAAREAPALFTGDGEYNARQGDGHDPQANCGPCGHMPPDDPSISSGPVFDALCRRFMVCSPAAMSWGHRLAQQVSQPMSEGNRVGVLDLRGFCVALAGSAVYLPEIAALTHDPVGNFV